MIALFLVAVAPCAAGAGVALRSRVVQPEEAVDLEALAARPTGRSVWVVELAPAKTDLEMEAGSPELRGEHFGDGVERVGWLPPNGALVAADPAALYASVRAGRIAWAAPLRPADRLAPELAAMPADRAVVLEVLLVKGSDLPAAVQGVTSLGATVLGAGSVRSGERLTVELGPRDRGQLAKLAALDGVVWIGVRPRYGLLNDTGIWVGQAGLDMVGATPVFDNGIHGEGQVVAVLDTGLDIDMCYFSDPMGTPPTNVGLATATNPALRKVIAYDFLWSGDNPADPRDYDDHDHGTHVAGSIAGDNLINPIGHDAGDGMAPGAKLVIQDGGFATDNCADLPALGCPVVDLTPIFDQTYQQGARIHSNSWGDRENFTPQNTYSAGSVDVDDYMWTHPDFLILFAAGNQGANNSVGSPSTAKNTIAVGSTLRGGSADTLSSFSSRGWTADGRIKPTVTCPGSGIVSANADGNINTNNCNTRSMSGTSMACPTCAGLAALARQYFTDGYYPSGSATVGDGFTPSAALLKAVLINSARPMANEPAPISRQQGFGRVTLGDTLSFPTSPHQLLVVDEPATFPTGDTGSYILDVDVVSAGEPLKVTLAWTDPPSNPMAATNLINDLDLIVTGPSGTFLGNVLTGGVSVPGGTADRLNVEEQVLIPAPMPGPYSVEIRAASVLQGPQGFGLVVRGGLGAGGCLAGLGPLANLLGTKGPGDAATFQWTDSGSTASEYHLNSVLAPADLSDIDPQSPRQMPRGQGTLECAATGTTCADPDALAATTPALLFYQVLGACGPGGADEGPVR